MSGINISWSLVDVVCSTTAVFQMSAGCDLWKGCVRWLRDLGVLGTTDDNGSMVEFASVLRDGVLLCRLANILMPNSIDQKDIIKTKQISQFTCFKNITKFVEFCRDKFFMKDEDLFTPGDLFYMTGFQKCLSTLSFLSRSPEALSKNIAPFPEICPEQSTSYAPNVEEEDIYQSLTENIENIDPDQTIYGPITSGDPDEQHNEQLYDHIVMTRKRSIGEGDTSTSMKREKCIKEIIDTETNYVENALSKIIERFYLPLKAIIPHDEYKIIFGNIENLMALHKQMLEDFKYPVELALGMNDALSRPNNLLQDMPKYIGEVFVKHRDGLLEYGQYCSNLMKSRDTCTKLMESDEFIKRNIMECTKFGDNQFSMQDLLSVPFQRITKYPLLIKELIKKTDVSSPERPSLMDAQEIIEDVCAYVNDMIRDGDIQKFINEIQKSIVDLSMPPQVLLKDYGRVNFDGEVKMAESTPNQVGRQKQRYVFIFDKVLVICKATNKQNTSFSYKNAFVISELSVDMNVSIDTKSGGTITRRTQHVIHLHRDRNDNNEVNHIAIYFKNEVSRQKWLNAFLLSKENVSPTEFIKDTNHKVTFTSFKVDVTRPEVCGICDKLMKGLYFQGYRCDNCFMTMHKACLALKRCEAGRRTSEPRSSQSFNINRPRQSFCRGEIVIATSSFTPSDLSFLQFRKDDRIEVVLVHADNRFTGCLVNNRTRTGLVNMDRVTRARTNSMIGMSPADSPAGSICARLDRKESTVVLNKQDSVLSDSSQFSSHSSARASTNGSVSRQQDYVNTEIKEYPWYMGDMERVKAENILRGTPNGTFLVRYSRNREKSVISLSYDDQIKHMIIEQTVYDKFYLDAGYIFNSIVELVQYYREHNLIDIFQSLDTKLTNPYLQCRVYTAIHDYEAPDPAPEGKFLPFKTGDIVVLLDTIGEDRGWWRGQANNKSGFFPLSYVQAVSVPENQTRT